MEALPLFRLFMKEMLVVKESCATITSIVLFDRTIDEYNRRTSRDLIHMSLWTVNSEVFDGRAVNFD